MVKLACLVCLSLYTQYADLHTISQSYLELANNFAALDIYFSAMFTDLRIRGFKNMELESAFWFCISRVESRKSLTTASPDDAGSGPCT